MVNSTRQMRRQEIFLSCVLPVRNERESIGFVLEELLETVDRLTDSHEVIVVDDGSTDGTPKYIGELFRGKNVKIIELSRNFGKEIAISAGLDHCKGNACVIMDGDGQHPPAVIEQFLKQWTRGFDVVFASRTSRFTDPMMRRVLTRLFYWGISKLADIKISSRAGDFRLIDRTVIEALTAMPESNRFMKGLYSWAGFSTISIEFEPRERVAGTKSISTGGLFELAITAVTAFSTKPLRVATQVGIFISLLSIIYSIVIFIKTIVYGIDTPGYASLMVAILFLGGLQLLAIGVLGEYLGRVFKETKRRPLYFVKNISRLHSQEYDS